MAPAGRVAEAEACAEREVLVVGVAHEAAPVDRPAGRVGVVVDRAVRETAGQGEVRRGPEGQVGVREGVELPEAVPRDPVLLLVPRGPGRVAAAAGGARHAPEPAPQVGIAGLGAEASPHRAGPAAGREDLDDAGECARPVEGRERAAHDLHVVDEARRQLLEVHGAALQLGRVVERDAVEQHQRVVRVAAAQERVRDARPAAAAERVEAGDLAQQVAGGARGRGRNLARIEDAHRAGGGGHRPGGDRRRLVEDRGPGRARVVVCFPLGAGGVRLGLRSPGGRSPEQDAEEDEGRLGAHPPILADSPERYVPFRSPPPCFRPHTAQSVGSTPFVTTCFTGFNVFM